MRAPRTPTSGRAAAAGLLAAALIAAPAALAPRAAAAQEGVRVIVHPAVPVTALPRDQVARLFLKKSTRWDARLPVQPVELPEGSPVRRAFARGVMRRSVEAVVLYWREQIYTARDVPPVERDSDAAVVAFVRATPGAIGYVSPHADVRGVRVLTVAER